MLLHFHQTRVLIFGAIAFLVLCATFLTDAFGPSRTSGIRDYLTHQPPAQWHSTASKTRWRELTDVWSGRKDPAKIILASVLYEQPEPNELLERALLTHEKHAERWGYATTVLRKRLVDGWWGKWSWLQALVTMELNKDPADAAEWIMFLSPTAVLNDPTIPLSLFLPPTSLTTNMTSSRSPGSQLRAIALNDIHFLGAYDAASPVTANPDFPAVSSAAFFLRVHPWTAVFLQHMLAAPLVDAAVVDEDFALAKTLVDVSNVGVTSKSGADDDDLGDDFDPAGFAHVVLQPERWYAWSAAAGTASEEDGWWLRAAEHFPPSLGGRRWKGLKDAVTGVEKGRMDRAYPFGYAEDAKIAAARKGWGRSFFFSSSSSSGNAGDDDNVEVPSALVDAKTAAGENKYIRPDPNVDGAGPAEVWDFWERIARARAVLREAEEVEARWNVERPGRVDGDIASQALAEGVSKVEAAMCWGAGRKAVLEDAIALVREAMYGRGRREEDGF
ncbi:hypothetical protein DBV05_g9695 [Lasiodiplodia theobromae]|uniref:Uncharacterized protein n=1 Tax=Lasiodiplodia theobromae TaxID=45133 RepID=A0A5N5D1S4_9PEZI|nr:hypothetical protein DBV05_g9695 [Lasiodiplodia theobromae]